MLFIQHTFVTPTTSSNLSTAKALLHRIPGCLEIIPFLASWIADESLKVCAVYGLHAGLRSTARFGQGSASSVHQKETNAIDY